jgi:hypothetical protein
MKRHNLALLGGSAVVMSAATTFGVGAAVVPTSTLAAARPAPSVQPARRLHPAAGGFVRLRTAAEATEIRQLYGRSALWAFDAPERRYRSLTNYRPAAGTPLYASSLHAAGLLGPLAALASAASSAGSSVSGGAGNLLSARVATEVVSARLSRFHRHHALPAAPTTASETPTTTPPAPPTTAPAPSTTAPAPVTPAGSGTSAPPPPPSSSTQPLGGAPGPWTLNFDDEFSQDSSLNTSKWTPYWFSDGSSSNGTTMLSSNVSVANGVLNLELTPSSGGLVSTNGKYQFTYGYAEARIYLPPSGSSIANWPAWWTDGQSWPADGEMDVMEGLGGQACFHFHSNAGGPGSCASGNFSGWHTFGADWEPGSVTYYYDGQNVGSITTGITGSPMYLILENSGGSYGGPSVTPSDMEVSYVRVWQHG